MMDEDPNNFPTIRELRDTDCIAEDSMERYAQTIVSMPKETPFQHFQAHRQALFGNLLPLFDKECLDEIEREKIQGHINQIKALGFFSEGYIDNLIIYFEALKMPFLGANYLIKIIDKYIKPDIRLQGMRPFQKFAMGYFCGELIGQGATKRPLIQMMEKHFLISKSEVESAINDYKIVAAYVDKNPSAYHIVDFMGVLLLWSDEFFIEDGLKVFGDHHLAIKAKEKFLEAYDKFSQRIDQTYIPAIADSFKNPPYFLDQKILPELKEYISSYNPENYKRHDLNIHAGTILSFGLIDMAPNLLDNRERLIELGWLNE